MTTKPIIGITCGDTNGVGLEIIIKIFSDNRMFDICTPVVFASSKAVNFYKKLLPSLHLNFQAVKDFSRINPKQVNVYNCWEEDIEIQPGQLTPVGGKYAINSLHAAIKASKEGFIQGLVTAPVHKKNIQDADFPYTGHTPFLKQEFNVPDVVMTLCSENFRVAVVTEHLPVQEVPKNITKESILSKLAVLNGSLIKDFGIIKPRIAVLGLNPHAGDEGLIGQEEEQIISPAIKAANNQKILAVGPFSADAFFAKHSFTHFDAVLAMYHDQGLIPFKTLAFDTGVNFTAGLPIVRTSPDHGVAFDIAGKSIADTSSFLSAIYLALDIYKNRLVYAENNQNPMKKTTKDTFDKMVDEVIRE